MTSTEKRFAGAIPEVYDTYLVPLIFEFYARDIAKRAAEYRPSSVLETAAGSGVVTRILAPLLQEGADYVVSDLNPPMLARARRRQRDDHRISWVEADALSLPFETGRFDVVLCQFGAMFFPDKAAGFREALRVLKPQGVFLFNVWDRIAENVFADQVTRAACEMFPDDPPRFLDRIPHGYHDPVQIGADLKEAGFSQVRLSTLASESRAASANVPAIAYCQGTPLRNELEERGAKRLGEVTIHAAEALRREFGTGPIAGKIQAHVLEARP